MSEELKTKTSDQTEVKSEPETKPAKSETKPVESETKPVEKITNEKELSREQKTAVKKLKDYSREAKKRVKQNDQTEGDDDSEQNEHTEDERSEIKHEKSETSINTFLAFGGVLIALAGLYLAHKNYLINQIKAGVHDDAIKIQPPQQIDRPKASGSETQKKPPKFRTL